MLGCEVYHPARDGPAGAGVGGWVARFHIERLRATVHAARADGQERGLRLKPPARVVSTRDPLVWLGWRIPRVGLTVSRKPLGNLGARLLGAAIRGPGPWRRTLAACRGLVP